MNPISLALIANNQALFELGHSTSRGHYVMSITREALESLPKLIWVLSAQIAPKLNCLEVIIKITPE